MCKYRRNAHSVMGAELFIDVKVKLSSSVFLTKEYQEILTQSESTEWRRHTQNTVLIVCFLCLKNYEDKVEGVKSIGRVWFAFCLT